jgi:uncharacterized protein (DUF1778 family)
MSALSIRIPESLHQSLKRAAQLEGVSVNQFVALCITEKVTQVHTMRPDERVQARLERPLVSRERFLELLGSVPEVEPEARDRL